MTEKESALQRSKTNYEVFARMLSDIAEGFGVDVSDETHEAWKVALLVSRDADNAIDLEPSAIRRAEIAREITAYFGKDRHVEPNNRVGSQHLGDYGNDLDRILNASHQDAREIFTLKLSQIFRITEEIKQVDTVEDFVRLTKLEGQIYFRALLALMSDEEKASNAYSDFHSFTKRFARLGNLGDSLIDLRSDAEVGNVQIEPSVRNRAIMGMGCVKEIPGIVRQVGVSHAGAFARLTKQVYDGRADSKRHVMPEVS